MLIDGYVAEHMKNAMLNSEQEQVKIYNAYYNKGIINGYNQALEDLFNKCKEKYPKNYANEPELGGASCVFSLNDIETFKKELII